VSLHGIHTAIFAGFPIIAAFASADLAHPVAPGA
jgi:hypothetical protein